MIDMDLKLEKVVTYFLFPGLLFPCVCYLLYLALSAPLGLVLLPGLALLACHHHYRGKHDDVLIEDPGRYNVIVVGAGVSGLIAGARLSQQGLPFTILEAATEVGGTWHYNTYPGCACDVWTSLYQITFCPNPNWSRYATLSTVRQSGSNKEFDKIFQVRCSRQGNQRVSDNLR